MRRLLQPLQQKWLLRSPVQVLRTVPTSFDARPCFPREPLLPLPPPLPAPARAQWRLERSSCLHFIWMSLQIVCLQGDCCKCVSYCRIFLFKEYSSNAVMIVYHGTALAWILVLRFNSFLSSFLGSFHFINRCLWPSSQAGTSVR